LSDAVPDRGVGGFVRRNRDALWLEVIGGVILAFAVSGVMFAIDAARENSRNAHDEALSNSLFVRQGVMNGADVLPFAGLYLDEAQLSGLTLDGADFADATLTGAELKGSSLRNAVLAEADLTGADLTDADLTGADLSEAMLADADLTGATLTEVLRDDASLDGAWYLASEPPAADQELLDELRAVGASEADEDDD